MFSRHYVLPSSSEVSIRVDVTDFPFYVSANTALPRSNAAPETVISTIFYHWILVLVCLFQGVKVMLGVLVPWRDTALGFRVVILQQVKAIVQLFELPIYLEIVFLFNTVLLSGLLTF